MAWVRKQGTVGRCRARPPTRRGFPVVFEDDWCLGHKLDEETFENDREERLADYKGLIGRGYSDAEARDAAFPGD